MTQYNIKNVKLFNAKFTKLKNQKWKMYWGNFKSFIKWD